jgi:protein-tyrosine phosphatase
MYSNATEILPGLWLGDTNASQDPKFISEKVIQCVINCTVNDPFVISNVKLKYRVPIKERIDPSVEELANIYQLFDQVCSFIETNHHNYNILIHCTNGTQVSPTILTAYLIKHGKIPCKTAIELLKTKRPSAFEPKCEFKSALELLQENENI